MLVLHLGEDPAVKEQFLIYLADIIKGKKKKMITTDFNSCYFEMSLILNFTEVSLCFCVRVSKLREVVGVPILKCSGTS